MQGGRYSARKHLFLKIMKANFLGSPSLFLSYFTDFLKFLFINQFNLSTINGN